MHSVSTLRLNDVKRSVFPNRDDVTTTSFWRSGIFLQFLTVTNHHMGCCLPALLRFNPTLVQNVNKNDALSNLSSSCLARRRH